MKSHLLLLALFGSILWSCSSDQHRADDSIPVSAEVETTEDKELNAPAFEEVLPDSGLMENINPEEIITDDWTSDSPDAEAGED